MLIVQNICDMINSGIGDVEEKRKSIEDLLDNNLFQGHTEYYEPIIQTMNLKYQEKNFDKYTTIIYDSFQKMIIEMTKRERQKLFYDLTSTTICRIIRLFAIYVAINNGNKLEQEFEYEMWHVLYACICVIRSFDMTSLSSYTGIFHDTDIERNEFNDMIIRIGVDIAWCTKGIIDDFYAKHDNKRCGIIITKDREGFFKNKDNLKIFLYNNYKHSF